MPNDNDTNETGEMPCRFEPKNAFPGIGKRFEQNLNDFAKLSSEDSLRELVQVQPEEVYQFL